MTAEPPVLAKPPGFWWIVLLGVVGFCAGFFGPLVFVPDANQGPLVGILITGPGGAMLGLVLFVLMKFLPLSARAQWRLLQALCVLGVLGICLVVQPAPVTRGYLLEVEVTGVRTPAQTADEVIADWQARIAPVAWATPRAGWERQMRADLAKDPGRVIDGVLVRRRAIKMHRKPWNRGRLFAAEWQTVNEKHSYYARAGEAIAATVGTHAKLYIVNDTADGIPVTKEWPPLEVESFINLSRVEPLPAEFAALGAQHP